MSNPNGQKDRSRGNAAAGFEVGLKRVDGTAGETTAFEFGASTLWIDRVASMSQAELWLEIVTDDTAAA